MHDKLVESLARPGGNVTGVVLPFIDLAAKRVQLLKEVSPHVRNVAIIVNTTHPTGRLQAKRAEGAAASLGMTSFSVSLLRIADTAEAFARILEGRADALLVTQDAVTFQAAPRIAEFALQQRLPASHAYSEFVAAGGLISYGMSLPQVMEVAASLANKILRGANPAELPAQQPTKAELGLNLKTAKALGLTIPPSLLLRADQVVE